MFVELKEMKNKEQRNKSPFEKFKPKFERYFEKGRLLKPIYDKDGLITKIDLSENNSNIYGNLVVGILALTLFILPIVLDGTYTYDSEFSKYLGIAIWIFFTLIVGSFMTISSIKKLRNSNEREFLSVNGNGIKYRNPDSKIFRNYSWGKIKDVQIKIYRNKYGNTAYLLILLKTEKLIDINISILTEGNVSIFDSSEWKKTFHTVNPEYIKLRSLLGQYLENRKEDSIK